MRVVYEGRRGHRVRYGIAWHGSEGRRRVGGQGRGEGKKGREGRKGRRRRGRAGMKKW